MDFLFDDPRPELSDTIKWSKLLKRIPKRFPAERAEPLSKRLWMFRSFGTLIQNGKLIPLLGPNSEWNSKEHFSEYAAEHLTPYAKEIQLLIRDIER